MYMYLASRVDLSKLNKFKQLPLENVTVTESVKTYSAELPVYTVEREERRVKVVKFAEQ